MPSVADSLALVRAQELAPDKRLKHLADIFDGDLTDKQRKFLAAIAKYGGVRQASFKANMPHSYHYKWLFSSPTYEINYARARSMYSDMAESAIMQRGIDGYEKPLSYKGQLTGDTVREYSDTLAAMVIKALKPEYRDGNQIAIGPAKISIEITQGSKPADDEIVIKSE